MLLTNLQVDFDGLTARYDEEQENGVSLRAQLGKAAAELQQLRSRYDKDMVRLVEEMEEMKYVL